MGIHQGIVDEGSSSIIISSSSWKALGSPKLVLATNELLSFDKRPTWKPLLRPIGPSNMVFSLESDLVFCETSSPGICELSNPNFMEVELPSNGAILEAMILDFRPLLGMETVQFDYQKIHWLGPSNRISLENYYA
jgi:hypothetical protein